MKVEALVSNMMTINTLARIWHWSTDTAQHHVTFEQFLTQNETLTDSLMESSLGNEIQINFSELGVKNAVDGSYSIDGARAKIKDYRAQVFEAKGSLEKSDIVGSEELITILDDVTELASKTLYLLKLK